MEKYRISVSSFTAEILIKDMKSFGFLKGDGAPNKNEFLNRLILNYADDYTLSKSEQRDAIGTLVSSYADLSAEDRLLLSNSLIRAFTDRFFVRNEDDETVILSLKPVKASEALIECLIEKDARGQSISSFFREMFDAYVNLPQPQRERIVFKDIDDDLRKAQRKGRKTFIKLKTGDDARFTGTLYALGVGDEETYNYALFNVGGAIQTVRLCKIASVKILNEPATITESLLPLLEFQTRYGIAYPVNESELEPVRVRLTDKGEKLFQKLYLYRPNYYERDGDDYVFHAPHMQIFTYFTRFGKEAIIRAPQSLVLRMRHFYRSGAKAYQAEE